MSTDYLRNPYPPESPEFPRFDNIHQKLSHQGVFIFTASTFSIAVPTKTGSTSLRHYLKDTKLKRLVGGGNIGLQVNYWDNSPVKIVVLRHPMERYYSGLIEMTKHGRVSEGQSFEGSWKSHIHPVCSILVDCNVDYHIILLEELSGYISEHYTMNQTIQEAMDPKVKEFHNKVKRGQDTFAELHRRRDNWWLRKECEAYNKIIRSKNKLDSRLFKDLINKGIRDDI